MQSQNFTLSLWGDITVSLTKSKETISINSIIWVEIKQVPIRPKLSVELIF